MLGNSYFCAVKIHEKYIRRCIEIGKKGLGSTAPNPMVGAVITYNDRIIGEGYTSPFGGPHAEVNAINAVADKSLLSNAALYVTLEPCSHYGKTPPCVDLILQHNIKKVYIGILDPNELVAGSGINRLRESGCEVHVGILEKECRFHHRRFLCYHEKNRPYIILKWAQTKNHYLAPVKELRATTPTPYWISNSVSRQRVHQWRSEEQAILVGTNTILEDNPSLNVRDWHGTSPIRILLDRHLKVSTKHKIYDPEIAPTIVLTEKEFPNENKDSIQYERINFENNVVSELCSVLHKNRINSVIVEGGAITLRHFLESTWDEARVITGNTNFTAGIKAPQIKTSKTSIVESISDNTLDIYYND